MPIQTLAQMQNFFSSQSFQTFKQVAGIMSGTYPDLGTKMDKLSSKDGAESFWKELPPNNPLSELAEQNDLLVSKQLAEASAVLNDIAALATSIHALFSKRPRDSAQRTDISSLSNELLARIFEEATSQPFGFTAISETLSHVCRRWRFISLGLPTLWAEADLSHCQEKRDVFLERSRNAPLTVDIKGLGNDDIVRLYDAINDIVPLTERWSRLRFFIEDGEARFNVLSFMGEEHSTLNVPLLTDLEVKFLYGDDQPELEDDEEGVRFFYSRWKMPNLRSLNVKGCLAPHTHLHDMTFGTNLIRCSLELSFENEDEMTLSNSCWDFLRNHPSLEEFELMISCSVDEWDSAFTPITLPNLKTLVVCLNWNITDSDGERNTMVHFMNSLDMPFLSKFVIILEGCMDERLNRWVNVFLNKPPYPNLVDVTLQVLPKLISNSNVDYIVSLLTCTPNVRKLTLFTPTMTTYIPYDARKALDLPYLREVALMQCNIGHVDNILINGSSDLFEHLSAKCSDDLRRFVTVQRDIIQSH